jgi:hypothetical protein
LEQEFSRNAIPGDARNRLEGDRVMDDYEVRVCIDCLLESRVREGQASHDPTDFVGTIAC